ncbi:MAG: prohibitin family protein [Parcubacteria group bacterium]|nr:prohibitin family protein [Parcubacteria group bacterium]
MKSRLLHGKPLQRFFYAFTFMSDDSLDRIMYSFVVEDVLGGFFVSVPPGHVGCVYDRGKGVLKRIYTPGLHLKIPFWQKAKIFNTQTLEYTIRRDFNPENFLALGDKSIEAVTHDREHVIIEGTLLLRLDAKQIPSIWQNIGEDFVPKIIRPAVRSRIRLVASKYDLESFFSAQRDKIELEMKQEIENILYSRGIYIENVLLSEIGKR